LCYMRKVTTRYPNSVPDSIPARVYTAQAARDAVSLAAEIVSFVRHKISESQSHQ
jgi:HEPN domain-containing protein